MDALDLARWQFAVTICYHYLFVPLTIGLGALVAGLQTAWYRTGREHYLDLTHFYGKLFGINFAMGVVTGIVQEFQFGMNWSDYSRFVGDVFGAPLALESLLAFFLESTFLGLWIFGWNRLPRLVHLGCIWLVALGSMLSSVFILAANSWMQNPVGYVIDAGTGRARLTDFFALLTNKVLLVTVPHTLFAAFMVAGGLVLGTAAWHLRGVLRETGDPAEAGTRRARLGAWRAAMRLGAVTLLVAGAGVAVSGDVMGKVMTEVQPMKMAAAEALYQAQAPASFSLFTIGTLDGSREITSLRVPYLLSFLATGSFTGQVQGVDDVQAAYAAAYGPGDYAPYIPLTYWSFRLMIGVGMLAVLAALWALWVTRRGRLAHVGEQWPARAGGRWFVWSAAATPLLPIAANLFGWIFTETGRQPWLVFGLMRTADGVSPGTTAAEVAISLTGFAVLYAVLAVIEARLMLRAVREGLALASHAPGDTGTVADEDGERPLSFAY